MKTERFLKVAKRYTEDTGYLREDEYDDAHSQTHDNQAEEKYILKNSVKEHHLFMEEGEAKDINLLMKLIENNIQDHDMNFKQRLRCHHGIN